MLLNENGSLCPTRERFDADRARTSVAIEESAADYTVAQSGEEALAQPVWRGPRLAARGCIELSGAEFAGLCLSS